jgi:hypothetical protein
MDLAVTTGSVTMGGSTEITCDLAQDEHDLVTLKITVTAACNTIGDLDVLTRIAATKKSIPVHVTLRERNPVTFSGPTVAPPDAKTLIRTRVKGTCEGPIRKIAWGTANCVVP